MAKPVPAQSERALIARPWAIAAERETHEGYRALFQARADAGWCPRCPECPDGMKCGWCMLAHPMREQLEATVARLTESLRRLDHLLGSPGEMNRDEIRAEGRRVIEGALNA